MHSKAKLCLWWGKRLNKTRLARLGTHWVRLQPCLVGQPQPDHQCDLKSFPYPMLHFLPLQSELWAVGTGLCLGSVRRGTGLPQSRHRALQCSQPARQEGKWRLLLAGNLCLSSPGITQKPLPKPSPGRSAKIQGPAETQTSELPGHPFCPKGHCRNPWEETGAA